MVSRFGARTTALQAISGISPVGKNAMVTGGSAGLGLETSRALVAAAYRRCGRNAVPVGSLRGNVAATKMKAVASAVTAPIDQGIAAVNEQIYRTAERQYDLGRHMPHRQICQDRHLQLAA